MPDPTAAPGAISKPDQSVAPDGSLDLARMLTAEGLGAGVLGFLVVAAGVLGERYAGGNIGLAMLATALSASAGFAVLARTLGDAAPSLFNPAFAFGLVIGGRLPLMLAMMAGATQIAAACFGVMIAHMVTNTGLVQIATQIQTGTPVWIGEGLAGTLTVFTLLRLAERPSPLTPLFGALAMLATMLATPSLSLANPAVTLARGLTDSFTSIRLADAGLILACQFGGALVASVLALWLFPRGRA